MSPSSMHAIALSDDRETARWQHASRPVPSADEVLVRVHAAGVNRADLVQRSGNYPPPQGASLILGIEVAGEVVEVGGDQDPPPLAKVGARVCALLTGGGYAEYVIVHRDLLLPIPKGFSMVEAASLPEVYFTAWLNVFMLGQATRKELALLHAGASGVGTAAIQLCREFGVDTIATASAHKLARLKELGATHALDRRNEAMFETIQTIAKERGGVDLILDPVAANYLEGNIASLGLGGRLVLIGLMSGREASLNLGRVLIKRISILGSTLRSRPLDEKIAIAEELKEHVWPLFSSGALAPIIDSTFPVERTDEAHERLRSNETTGKVILEVNP